MLRNVGLRKSVEQPVLDLNFAASQIGSNGAPDSRIDFSRGSNAWFVDSDGLVKKSPHNLQVNSEDFSEAGWSKTNSTVEANSITAPDGTLTADKIVGNSTNSYHNVTDGFTVISGNQYWISIYIKAGSAGTEFAFIETIADGTLSSTTVFDFGTETILATDTNHNHASVTDVGNGWYRFACSITPNANRTGNLYFGIADGTDPTYDATGEFIYFWGVQVSQHTTLPVDNPYVKTEGSAVYAARLDHDASWFMSAAQEQNLLEHSEMLDDSYWTKASVNVTANAETDPLGGTTAEYIFATSPSGDFPYLQASFDTKKGAVHTVSFYAKAGEIDVVTVGIRTSSGGYVSDPFNDQALTSEWQRFSGTFTATEDTHVVRFFFGSGAKTWSGDQGFYIWGTQIEVGSTASTYHRTEGAPYYGPGATPKGLLIEEARTNLLTDSDVDAWFDGTRVTITTGAALAPDGTTTAEKVAKTAASFKYVSDGFTAASTGDFTASGYLKAGSLDEITILLSSDGAATINGRVIIDLTNETSTDNASAALVSNTLTDVGNGWYRFTVTATFSNTTNPRIYVYPGVYNESVAGDIFVWGFQVEAGSFATSFIQTTGSTATRNADVATMGPTTGGTELVTNGTFDTDSDWTLATGWLITGGEAVASSLGQYKGITSTTLSLVAGRRYRASMDIASYTAGSVDMRYREGGSIIANTGDKSATGTFTLDFTCTDAASPDINIQTRSPSTNTFSTDNVSVRELYPFEQYNPSEGTVVSDHADVKSGKVIWGLINDDGKNFNDTLYSTSSTFVVRSGGSSTASIAQSENSTGKIASAFKENSIQKASDGVAGIEDTSAALPSKGIDRFTFGVAPWSNGNFICGTLKRISFYNRRLPDETLESLSDD